MRCSKTKKLISPYLDGELRREDVTALEFHVKKCHECRKRLAELSELHKMFSGVQRYQAPYGFTSKVMANLTSEKPGKMPLIAGFARALAFCLVIAAGIVPGNLIGKRLLARRNGAERMASSFSLHSFDPAPPGSVGGAYLAMTEGNHEN